MKRATVMTGAALLLGMYGHFADAQSLPWPVADHNILKVDPKVQQALKAAIEKISEQMMVTFDQLNGPAGSGVAVPSRTAGSLIGDSASSADLSAAADQMGQFLIDMLEQSLNGPGSQAPPAPTDSNGSSPGSNTQSGSDVPDVSGPLLSLVTFDAADTLISSNGFESAQVLAVYIDFSADAATGSLLDLPNLQVNYSAVTATAPVAIAAAGQVPITGAVPSSQVVTPSSQIAMPSSQVQTPTDVMTSLDLQPALCGR